MTGFIKVKTKELLLNNTFKLFLVSFSALILKTSAVIPVIMFTHFSLVSSFLQELVITYNSLLVYFIYSLIIVILFFLLSLFLSGIKIGENAIYFMESKGCKARFKYLFIFLKPSQSFRAFMLNLKLFNLRLLWFTFFFLPPLFCLALTIYLYFNAHIYTVVFFTLLFGTVILLSISRFFYNCTIIRYAYSLYYLCTDLNLNSNEAISKSIENADGFIKDGVFLKTSFLPWILSCIFIIPLFYVLPFIKLTKAKFITFTDGLHKALPQNFNYPVIYNNKNSNRTF